jgi:hypothetical protein
MKKHVSSSALLMAFILVFGISLARTQQTAPSTTVPEYKPGQVWTYKTASGAEGSRVVILKIEPSGKKDRLVHVRIDNMPLPSCGGFHLTTAIEHLAVSEKALRKSTVELVKDQIELPDSFFVAYKQWEKDHHKPVTNQPLAEVALPQTVGPMICNLREVT